MAYYKPEETKKLFYESYLKFKDDNKKLILKTNQGYFVKKTSRYYYYTYNANKAKVFNSLRYCELLSKQFNKNNNQFEIITL